MGFEDFAKEYNKKELTLNANKYDNSHLSTVEFDLSKIEEAKSTLNEEQTFLFEDLVLFVNTPECEYYVVAGYAGTGKTYTISKFVSTITSKVAVTAPTNKAVKVLADNGDLKGYNIIYSTIHKLLALKMVWQPPLHKGGEPRHILVRNLRAEITINDYSILILDEASMLSYELFNMINQEKDSKLKVIFMGDPAQIPPVGEIDSIPLLPEKRAKFNMKFFELKQIMRQAKDSQILEVAYAIRDNRFKDMDALRGIRKTGSNVIFYPNSQKESFNEVLVEHFLSSSFKEDANYAKVISWTNATVDYYNTLIRERYFNTPNLAKIMKGEKLIANESIIQEGQIIFNTSDEFEVVDYDIRTMNYRAPGRENEPQFQFEGGVSGGLQLKYYKALVKYGKPVKLQINGSVDEEEENLYIQIDILHEESDGIFKAILGKLRKYGKDTNQWQPYYQMMERFASVKYNYAITAHKSQGSTYQIVFLIEDDIDKNPKYIERNRIKYTASTRPKLLLNILSGRNK